MGTIILFTILGIILSIRYEHKLWYHCDYVDYIIATLKGFFLGMIAGAIIAIVLPCVGVENVESKEIVSLQDGSAINGHAFLGSGRI